MSSLINCLTETLGNSISEAKAEEYLDSYKQLVKISMEDGYSRAQAEMYAQHKLIKNKQFEIKEREKRAAKNLTLIAEYNSRIKSTLESGMKTSRIAIEKGDKTGGAALARAAISFLDDDPRFGWLSYATIRETTRGVLYSKLGGSLEAVRKGLYGRQVGKAHLPNIVRELFDESTGDQSARMFASSLQEALDTSVDMFNRAGGSLVKRKQFRLPQHQSVEKMIRAGKDAWVQAHLKAADWDAMRWPDGSRIAPEQRVAALEEAYKTLSTNGASKIDETKLGGGGSAIGNALEDHRFLIYKDAESWLKIHEDFSDGNIFDAITSHIDYMAHKISMVEVLGPSPGTMSETIKAMVRKHASSLGGEAVQAAEAELKNTFDPLLDVINGVAVMDRNSTMANLTVGMTNALISCQLGSAAFLAIPGDFAQTLWTRGVNKMDLFGGVGEYIGALLTSPKRAREIATQSGFVMDEVVTSIVGSQRFTGLNTIGPELGKRLSDVVMRASLLTPHTNAAKWATRAELMGALNRERGVSFDELEFKHVFGRYGITSDDWDVFRSGVPSWRPAKGVELLRPIDVLQTDVRDKDLLYRKFQGMILAESKKMVPETTMEATIKLKGTTKPDTLRGVILQSVSMYKSFPITFLMTLGRTLLEESSLKKRALSVASLGAMLTLAGALGTQLREISRGREPLPMNTPAFLGKAILSGGAASMYGDFAFAGVNQYGAGPEQLLAGPLVGWLGDTTQLAFGDVFKFADSVGSLSDERFKGPKASQLIEYGRRHMPGTNLWWARLGLERLVFDQLQLLADPAAKAKMAKRERRREREFGNKSFWPPGS